MSNAQRRQAQRHRNKTFPGPMTPADHQAAAERNRRLRLLYQLRTSALLPEPEQYVPPLPIPTKGAARRRAKAVRQAQA